MVNVPNSPVVDAIAGVIGVAVVAVVTSITNTIINIVADFQSSDPLWRGINLLLGNLRRIESLLGRVLDTLLWLECLGWCLVRRQSASHHSTCCLFIPKVEPDAWTELQIVFNVERFASVQLGPDDLGFLVRLHVGYLIRG